MIAAATPHSCTCPQEIRKINHQRTTGDWWSDPEWRKVNEAYFKTPRTCAFCGRPARMIHHNEDWMYRSREAYFNPANFTPVCRDCHYQYRKGRVICPVCNQHYMPANAEKCRWCQGWFKTPDQVTKSKTARRRIRQRHPCGNRTGQQRCQRNGRLYVCGFSSAKAPECDHFCEKVGARA